MNTYLLEIGLEEMPAQMILPAVEQLKNLAQKTCEQCQLDVDEIRVFSTPRRLAVQLRGLPEKQADRSIELKGPPAAIAKNPDDTWSKAAQGFAKKNGISPEDLEIREFQGKNYLFAQHQELGQPVPELLQAQVTQWILQLNFPKNMRWGAYRTRFIRPIRWLVSLWNETLVPLRLEMIEAGNSTRGHRFLSRGESLLKQATDYEEQLESIFVTATFEKRRNSIISQIQKLEQKHGFKVEMSKDLLEEVTNLVEWPTVILGDFETEFLELPNEIPVTCMTVHQRYFPVYQKAERSLRNGKNNSGTQVLLPHFVTVRNGNDYALDTVRRGNAKVLRARLSDARFFYQEDQKTELDVFRQKAGQVVFFQKRGSQSQRSERIVKLSVFIAKNLGCSEQQQRVTGRIAELCKFDLESKVVYEFPELQGTMGEDYARLKNEPAVVCRGIREHYLPRNAQDKLPEDMETLPVAIADKLDLLTTAFSLGMIPSGSADPYALRRMAQGITQLILEMRLALNPKNLTAEAIRILVEQQTLELERFKLQKELLDFLNQRQRRFMQEQGIRYDLIDAVLQSRNALPTEQLQFAEFLGRHLDSEIFKKAVEAVVRAANISNKYRQQIGKNLEESALSLPEEKNFFVALQPFFKSERKTCWTAETYLEQLCALESIVTRFFANVTVMDEDPVKCGNRLWLCRQLAEWSGRHLDLRAIVFH